MHGTRDGGGTARTAPTGGRDRGRRAPYGYSALIVGLCTAVAWAVFPYFERSNLIMAYLLGVVVVATRYGRGPSVLASVLSVAAFDFFFVPPYFTFAVADTQYFVTFGVMLIVALVISTLAVRIRTQAESARERERHTAALYAMSRELAGTRGVEDLLRISVRHISEVFRAEVVALLPDAGGRLRLEGETPVGFPMEAAERDASRWAFEHHRPAGLGTATLPGARALYLPLVASRGTLGVLGVRPAEPRGPETPDQLPQLEAFASQTALAIERARLAREAQEGQVRIETERLRNSLLSSVSHDLRTPLAGITGAISTILESGGRLDAGTRKELLETARDEADRLNRIVENLLEMTRLQAGTLQLRKDWHPVEEVIGVALGRFSRRLADRPITTRVPANLPLVSMDALLIEQVLINLLENALKYTPPGSPIEIIATATDEAVTIELADRGPGLKPGEEGRVFDQFYRSERAAGRGTGLGLAICQGIIRAHAGRIWAHNLPGGGVAFLFTLPISDKPPAVVSTDA